VHEGLGGTIGHGRLSGAMGHGGLSGANLSRDPGRPLVSSD
jgi:hypothetical protein